MKKEEIVGILKEEGLDIAEDMAEVAVKAAFRVIAILIPKISNGLGAVIVPLLTYAEPLILDIIDKIDGEED